MSFITLFNQLTIFFVGLIWLGIVTYLRLRRKATLTYLLFFSIFYIYVVKVLDYTLFQFQSLLILKQFMPNLMLNGQTAGRSLNLIPLATLSSGDLKTSLLNILLMIPFGFGLPFITNFHLKKVVFIGTIFSILIELSQLTTGLIAKMTFRVADINDVIFNTLGVALGYILFIGFARVFRRSFQNSKTTNPILQYIAEKTIK